MIPVDRPGNEDTLRTIRDLVRKTTAHSSLHRRQHLQFPLEERSEANRNHCCEQFSAAGTRVWQSSALVSPTGDDIEPIAAPREDVEMENDEDDEPLEAEVPRGQEHEESCVDIKGLVLSTSAEPRG